MKKLRLIIPVLLLLASSCMASVQETVLSNGLTVITKEVHAAPVVSFMVWYRVGSRNEELGKTGISHLLEHMQFKGTANLPKGEIDALIHKSGATNNAGTTTDYTYYYETLPADKLELAARIEADRMTGSLLDPKELAAETTVVLSEMEGYENDPETLAFRELFSSAYSAHPYQWPIIGWRHDVEGITREDVYSYYKTYCQPNNAVVVIVGDFETESALHLVEERFGPIPKGPEPPKVRSVEPPQPGPRRSIVEGEGSAARVAVGYHIPAASSPDTYALDVLQTVLGTGESSRLYKALVDKGIATDAWAWNMSAKDPGLFILGGTASDGVAAVKVENALLSEAERIKSDGVNIDEIKKAVNQIESGFVLANDSVSAQAELLGSFEMTSSWHNIDKYLPGIRAVTPEDVRGVARRYLTPENGSTVSFIPTKEKTPEPPIPPKEIAPAPLEAGSGAKTAPTRTVLDNGMVVIVKENRSNPTVAIYGSANAGSAWETSPDLARVTAEMLTKGTKNRPAEKFASELDFAGAELEFSRGVVTADV
ncbi:MAG: M16 family metallopeptidase, partial [Armatimonadota bacterium]